MKSIKYLLIIYAIFSIAFVSCTKEDIIVDIVEPVEEIDATNLTDNPLVDQIEGRDDNEGCDLGCFIINYPFSLVVDGNIIEINSEESLNTLIEDSNDNAIVDFVYPLTITFQNGETENITNADELGYAFSVCVPDEGWDINADSTMADQFPAFLLNSDEHCYSLTYPINLTDENNSTITINSEDEFVAQYTNGNTSILFFTFPLTLIDQEGEFNVVEDVEGLLDLLVSCEYNNTGEPTFNPLAYSGCYDFQYPLNLLLINDEEITVNAPEEYFNILFNGIVSSFIYPITLVDYSGEQFPINTVEELQEAYENCEDVIDGNQGDATLLLLLVGDNEFNEGGENGCYDINFPVNATVYGETKEFSNTQDVINAGEALNTANLIFPVSVILNATGEEIEINNVDEILNILSNC